MNFWGRRGKLGKALIIGLVVIVALSIAGALIPADDEESASETTATVTETVTTETVIRPPETEPPAEVDDEPEAAFGDGTHRVGQDIQPGTYRAPDAAGCYWARLRNFSGDLDSILANANESGPTVVTILRSDRGFESTGCGDWTADLSQITASRSSFGEGTYIVGVDIAPGQYASEGTSGCYWARLRDFTGGLRSILANDNASGRAIVQIAKSDRGFQSSGCGTWSR